MEEPVIVESPSKNDPQPTEIEGQGIDSGTEVSTKRIEALPESGGSDGEVSVSLPGREREQYAEEINDRDPGPKFLPREMTNIPEMDFDPSESQNKEFTSCKKKKISFPSARIWLGNEDSAQIEVPSSSTDYSEPQNSRITLTNPIIVDQYHYFHP